MLERSRADVTGREPSVGPFPPGHAAVTPRATPKGASDSERSGTEGANLKLEAVRSLSQPSPSFVLPCSSVQTPQ